MKNSNAINKAIQSNNEALIKVRLDDAVKEYKKTTGSYFNIANIGAAVSLAVLGKTIIEKATNIYSDAASVAVYAGIWGAGRMGYECYQRCFNYQDAYIGKNFSESMKSLRAEEAKSFKNTPAALKILGSLEQEIIDEGNKVFPNIEIMEKKLLECKLLRELMLENLDYPHKIIDISNELLTHFNNWKAIQKGRELPGVAQLVVGMSTSIAASGYMGPVGEIVGPIVTHVLPNANPKTSYEDALKPTAAKSATVFRKPLTRPLTKTFADIAPPYFVAYEINDQEVQVELILKMENQMKERYPDKKSIPIQPDGVDLILEVLNGYNKERGVNEVSPNEQDITKITETLKIENLEVPTESILEESEGLGVSSEDAIEEQNIAQKDIAGNLIKKERIDRSVLADAVDKARHKKIEELREQSKLANAAYGFKKTGIQTKTTSDDPHKSFKDRVAKLPENLTETGRNTKGSIGRHY